MALKVVVAEPAGTVIEDPGTGSSALLLESETAAPPAGAASLRVTEQVVAAPEIKLADLQDSEEIVIPDTRLIVAVCDTPLSLAVSVALSLLGILLAAMARKLVVVEPAATVADLETGSSVLLLDKATHAPPEGAAWLKVTVHEVLNPAVKVAGMQDSPESVIADTRLIVAVCETPLKVAVNVAL